MTELGSTRQPSGSGEAQSISRQNEQHKEAIDSLVAMFPNLSHAELSNALEANSFSVQRTVDYILSEKTSVSSPKITAEDAAEVAARIAQVEEDERLARALQSAFERENTAQRQAVSQTGGDPDAAQPPLMDKLKLYGRAAKAKFWELYESYLGDGSGTNSIAGVQPIRSDGYSSVPNTDEVAVARRSNSEEFQGSTLLRRHWNQGENTSSTYRQANSKRANADYGDGKKDK
ncbi:hypothetical protein Gasu2_46230 [Galdieria sulphuraria]|uniref:CUE domain-containing protein n=1 Tax=Galdieria sulphuraria TaxID=130081 RepID=M2Y6I1_GALSU|nr:uncharacterized protein Gasu_10240 [Galdieria sulphuraria]EME31638.1 hypothetical protein Gasu_10240 [Galdieria sulphuraria]GJD10432.1 hypothetical protein Gasu2_46230 [Galdieria sulphuraria]|eukprot:XP_005708158.1 hypothetical protein Gasu_10240 [Galdieria sulphuraria]